MNNRITYFMGAGASFQACPIWKEQGEKMIELANKYLPDEKKGFEDQRRIDFTESEKILWDIGKFGNKAIEYGTIDTYAKKLHLSGSDYDYELQYLKLVASIFFTLWEFSDDTIKERNGKKLNDIDLRYISLLAAILEKTSNHDPKLKDNIRFVTWNYDLQLERAFKSFCLDHLRWDYVSRNLKFRVNDEGNNADLDVCHLNGYHGYYIFNRKNERSKEYDTIERTDSKNAMEILHVNEFIYQSIGHKEITFNGHINFAWEDTPLAKATREQAKKIFRETDILVIIGYSFPPFNKEIDSMLFNELGNRKTTIYYQDPLRWRKSSFVGLGAGETCAHHVSCDSPMNMKT